MTPASVTITEDRLGAYLELTPPVSDGDVREAIEAAGVIQGLQEDKIAAAWRRFRTGAMRRPVRIARGKEPVPPEPSRFDLSVKSAVRAGLLDAQSLKIDYHERGTVCNVEEGQELGYRVRSIPGHAGIGVDGEVVPPPELGDSMAVVGDGIEAEELEDGRSRLIARFDGVLQLSPSGELAVLDVLEIDGDVNLELGNLDVYGSVVIHGSVRSGFRVTARGHITVDKSIEDAHVEAGRSVDVGHGILGGEEGKVIAGGNIRLSFGQNARIHAKGDVVLEDDARSRIEAGGKIVAREGAGHLRGGIYWAAEGLVARELGSDKGVVTTVVVGSDPERLHELGRVRRELRAIRSEIDLLSRERRESTPQIGSAIDRKQVQEVRQTMRILKELGEKEQGLSARGDELTAELDREDPPGVRVEGEVHQGVEIQIRRARTIVLQTRGGGTFTLDPETETVSSD
jgi:uncharacterized protein